MPKIDLTVTISVIVALAAIISPILTAIINNRYQLKLKKMELLQQEYERCVLYKRDILESYLQHAGNCIVHSSHDSLHKYGEFYLRALMYVPDNLYSQMIDANQNIRDYHWDEATVQLETIAKEIKQLLISLQSKQR